MRLPGPADIAKGFTRWKKPVETETLCLLPSETISMSEAAAFARVHCKDNEKHVWLLQGWKKAILSTKSQTMKKNNIEKLWKLQQDLTSVQDNLVITSL